MFKKHPLVLIVIVSCVAHFVAGLWLTHKYGGQVLYFENEDAIGYVTLAQSVAAGKGFFMYGGTSAVRTPLYPLILALPIVLHLPFALSVLVLQTVFATVTAVLIFLIGKLVWGDRAGIIAALLYAVEPYLLMSATLATTETFFNLCIVTFFYFAVRYLRSSKQSYTNALYAGLAIGAATLVRPVSLYLLPVTACTAVIFALTVPSDRKKRLASALLYTVAFFAVLSPWLWRQHAQFGRWRITNIDAYMSYYKVSPLVIADEQNISYNEATEVLRDRLNAQFPPSVTDADLYNSFRYYDYMVNAAKKMVTSNPLPVATSYAVSLIPSLFGTGYEYMLENVAGLTRAYDRVSYSNLIVQRGVGALPYILAHVDIFLAATMLGIILWAAAYLLILYTLIKQRRSLPIPVIVAFGIVIGYFVFFSLGPASHARYRLPTFPFWFLLIGFSIDFLAKKELH